MKKVVLFMTLISAFAFQMQAQNITTPPSGNNQLSSVKQHIGSLVTVKVNYSSPDVDGRTGKIWGTLVPYGLTDLGFGLRNPSPWRAGANENTTITFSHDVEIEGKPLKAGTYGLHLIVQENNPWTWIFSHVTEAWGSYFYRPEDDALKVDVQSNDADFREWLTYEFTDRKSESAELSLFWENKQVPMQISVPNSVQLYKDKISQELLGSKGFNGQNWAAAANYLLQQNHDLPKALEWAEASISAPFVGVKNFNNLQTKSNVLLKMGKVDDAMAAMNEAIDHPTANANQIHQYGRTLIGMGFKDQALKVLTKNHEKYDGAWPTNVGMARALSAVGKYDDAMKYAKMAHEEAPDKLNKDGLAAAIEKLKNKQDIN